MTNTEQPKVPFSPLCDGEVYYRTRVAESYLGMTVLNGWHNEGHVMKHVWDEKVEEYRDLIEAQNIRWKG